MRNSEVVYPVAYVEKNIDTFLHQKFSHYLVIKDEDILKGLVEREICFNLLEYFIEMILILKRSLESFMKKTGDEP